MDICNSTVNSNTYNIKFCQHITLWHMYISTQIMDDYCGTINCTINILSTINGTSDIYSPVYRTVAM